MDKRTIFEIHRLRDLGMKERKIARHLGISRQTVRKYLEHPDITKTRSNSKPSKLEPFYDLIKQLLAQWPDASAEVIRQRIADKGYSGSRTILRDYLQAIDRLMPGKSGC